MLDSLLHKKKLKNKIDTKYTLTPGLINSLNINWPSDSKPDEEGTMRGGTTTVTGYSKACFECNERLGFVRVVSDQSIMA